MDTGEDAQMAHKVNIHDAKTHFSRLLAMVGSGEEVIISRAGTPIARLVPYDRGLEPRRAGTAKGAVMVNDNFDDPLPDSVMDTFSS